jgi:hypothetical protein
LQAHGLAQLSARYVTILWVIISNIIW